MFNGTISSVPQTFTVVASQLNSQPSTNQSAPTTASKSMQPAASVLQSLPCQLLGQTSLVLTPVANGSTVTCAPLALATVANQVNKKKILQHTNQNTATGHVILSKWNLPPQAAQSLKRPLASPVIATESKRPSIIQTISAPMATSKLASPKVLNFTVDPNKTAEQLSVLRDSYTQCPFPEEDEVRISEWNDISCAMPYIEKLFSLYIFSNYGCCLLNSETVKCRWFSVTAFSVSLDLQANRDHWAIQRRDKEMVQWTEATQSQRYVADMEIFSKSKNHQIAHSTDF